MASLARPANVALSYPADVEFVIRDNIVFAITLVARAADPSYSRTALAEIRQEFAMKKQVFVVVLGSLLALAMATGAWSQGTDNLGAPNSPGTHAPSGTNGGNVRPGIATRVDPAAGSSGDIHQQHPEWFETKGAYRPCPSSVTFPNGRSACLGCPVPCRFHF
jgi:hypothetical protein